RDAYPGSAASFRSTHADAEERTGAGAEDGTTLCSSQCEYVAARRMTALYDGHNHLHDQRLVPWREAILAELPAAGIRGAIVNGTREEDWEAVRTLCEEHAWLCPAYGLHPWHVADRTPDWLERLAGKLRDDPRASL